MLKIVKNLQGQMALTNGTARCVVGFRSFSTHISSLTGCRDAGVGIPSISTHISSLREGEMRA